MCKCVASVYKPRCLEPPLVQPPYMLSRTSHLSRNVREVQGVRGRCSVGLRKVLQGPPPCARMVFSMLSPGEELGPPLCRQRALRCGGWRCARLGGDGALVTSRGRGNFCRLQDKAKSVSGGFEANLSSARQVDADDSVLCGVELQEIRMEHTTQVTQPRFGLVVCKPSFPISSQVRGGPFGSIADQMRQSFIRCHEVCGASDSSSYDCRKVVNHPSVGSRGLGLRPNVAFKALGSRHGARPRAQRCDLWQGPGGLSFRLLPQVRDCDRTLRSPGREAALHQGWLRSCLRSTVLNWPQIPGKAPHQYPHLAPAMDERTGLRDTQQSIFAVVALCRQAGRATHGTPTRHGQPQRQSRRVCGQFCT